MSDSVKRLQKQFHPKHYILNLEPDRDKMTFKGSVTITGNKVGAPSMRFAFHQKDLKITNAEVTYHGKIEQSVKISRINTHNKLDEVRLHADERLMPGSYSIKLDFKGKITSVMNGMYPCSFKYQGKKKQLIATQFESHHAREVFPCIDEPIAKATFDLTLTSPKGETVIANTPVSVQTEAGDKIVTSFETTPKMSTYLLAFIYGELDFKEAKTAAGVVVRAYATPDNVKFVDSALDVAVKCLDFYNDYYGINYPLAKCDLIALPDFASGAMENWGCITFREQTMLVDPENTSLAMKQYVALVVAHELAHQWFGNLVTMKWWTDLWLNEGFASWMEYMVIDNLFPEWNLWIQFDVDERQQGLSLDSLEYTHPVEVPVKHPDEIRTIFDVISYSKGASILNMLHAFVGPKDFREGLRYYLQKYSYSNTDTIDLWVALEEISKKPIKEFMNYWTSKPGYPLLESVFDDKKITLNQSRFFSNPSHKVKDETIWPIALLSNEDSLPSILKKKEASYNSSNNDRLQFNIGHTGFYRVSYNATHLEKLGEYIKRGHLEAVDRLGILSDVFAAAKAAKFSTAEALHFMSYYSDEDNFAVWDIISSSLGSIKMVMEDEELRDKMKPFTRDLVNMQLKRLGWNAKKTDNHFDQLLRPIILSMAAASDNPEIVKKCLDAFDGLHKVHDISPELRSAPSGSSAKRGVIDPDLRGTVFGTVARLGSKKEFDKLVTLHNNSTMSEERTALVAAITNFKQEELIDKALSMVQSDDVRLQDVPYWLIYSFMNRFAKKQTWQWVKDNWEWLFKNLGTDLSFYRMPVYAARAFSDKAFINEYKSFFKPLLSPGMDRSYHQGLEILEYNSAWRERSLLEIKAFFNQQGQSLKK
jgi:puromycin-sensitive aminopeptidase